MKAFPNHGVCIYDFASVSIFWCPGKSAPLPMHSSVLEWTDAEWELISEGQLSPTHWTRTPFLVGISKCRVRESYQMRGPLNTGCIFWYCKKSSFNGFPIYFWGVSPGMGRCLQFQHIHLRLSSQSKALAARFLNPYIFRFSQQCEFPGVQ